MLERFRKCPVLQGSRLIERAGLLLEERQIVLRVKDELTTAIEARMPGDLARAADDRDLVDEALDQDVAKTIGGWRRSHGSGQIRIETEDPIGFAGPFDGASPQILFDAPGMGGPLSAR